MIYLFGGLTAANLLLLATVFTLGPGAIDAQGEPTKLYEVHLLFGVAAGLMCALVHVTVFTYFVATSKWLADAADKAALEEAQYVAPSLQRKLRAFLLAMAAFGITFVTMIAGAGGDPTMRLLWPGGIHFMLAAATLVMNLLCALGEYHLIRRQGALISRVAEILGIQPSVSTQ